MSVVVCCCALCKMTLREYCEQTSLHGWFYIFSADKKFWKMLWTLVSESGE